MCCGLHLPLQAWARPAASQATGFPRPPFPHSPGAEIAHGPWVPNGTRAATASPGIHMAGAGAGAGPGVRLGNVGGGSPAHTPPASALTPPISSSPLSGGWTCSPDSLALTSAARAHTPEGLMLILLTQHYTPHSPGLSREGVPITRTCKQFLSLQSPWHLGA